MRHVYLTKEDLIDSYGWKGNLDLLNIIMLGKTEGLTIDEKLNIIGNEYDIPIEENFRKTNY